MYDATFKIIIFGDVGCGTTQLTQRFLTNQFVQDQTMTIGVDFEVKSLTVDGQKVKLQIWDFGGEERFRFLLPTYLRGARGSMFLYDITNYSSIAHIDGWLSVIREEFRAEDIFPIIAVGNRAHLVDQREVSSADGIKIAKSRGLNGFIEVSAKTGENVVEAFVALTRLMLDYTKPRELGVRPVITDTIGLEPVKERLIDDTEIKIKRILELEKEKKREQIISRAYKLLPSSYYSTQLKDKTRFGSFMNQNLEQWLETLKGLKKGCEEIIKSLKDKNEQYYYHYSFKQWKYLLRFSSHLLGEFKENSSSFYKMSDGTKGKLYNLFEIFIPCREILSDDSFGKNVRVTFEEYLKILRLEKEILKLKKKKKKVGKYLKKRSFRGVV